MNGIKLVDAVIDKPLQSIVGLIVAAVIYLFVLANQAQVAHAEINKDQEVTAKYQEQQDEMYEILIRVDENVKQLK